MSGRESTFKIRPSIELGLLQKRQQSELLSLALSKPSEYFRLRQDVIDKITLNSVEQIYETYWNILTAGIVNGKQIEYEFGGDTKSFTPQLPESKVNEFALRCAMSIKEIAEEAIEDILPMNYNELAVNSAKGVLKAKGIHI